MPRPHTLFTGQWADLPFEEVCRKAAVWGFDGLEIACDPRHLDVERAASDPAYVAERRAVLADHGLDCWAISAHLVGQAVCDDPIDFRHRGILPAAVWGDGDPEGVRRRAAETMKATARAARAFGVDTVVGFTGSRIWPYVAMFPPVPDEVIEAGYRDFAERWTPILDTFAEHGVRFALEVHPSEIAYDYWTAQRALEAVDGHPAFGFNWDPSHLTWQKVDVRAFLWDFRERIFHVDCKDTRVTLDGRNGALGSHLAWGDPRRGFDFASVGHGDVPWEACLRTLTAIGYTGPVSVEWEDPGMSREEGAPASLAYLRALDFTPPATRFDAAFAEAAPS
ncbi:sugar phosphate isomerase/epimerase family protein [Actinomadura macrotermitis]|uniref:Xylose isomerase-like TIM barrel domain-containing protein n=1 Tax=Actinomadura macrotermitis TaxID=2585200 RepID=A0A7K0BN07_9ACTN|nr:sugar phosphate isomerase/epimerase family protein [Actinomadura macrotermitis]MQY02094.1 hypothetical protein [Actinomadura macrotermitis]